MSSGLIQSEALDRGMLAAVPVLKDRSITTKGRSLLQVWSAALVVLPVFLQAPWVRLHPFSACVFTAVLMGVAIPLSWQQGAEARKLGSILVGFSGSWLAGSLFWGWLRAHPSWHLPVEALALPLALAGLQSRWRLGCAFYLSSLLGTAMTDCAMALTGVMRFWPQVVLAPLGQAGDLLNAAALSLRTPQSIVLLLTLATVIVGLARWFQVQSRANDPDAEGWAVASSVLITTVMVDGLFLAMALLNPNLSGLI